MTRQLIAIALGGSAGAIARFLVANGIYAVLGRSFPLGTLFVNVSGSFLMGLLTELMLQRFAMAVECRAAILVGFLGAYTTFSTFAVETLYLFEEGSLLKAFLNIFLSNVLCIAAVWFGLILGRAAFFQDVYPWFGHNLPYGPLALALLAAFLLAALSGFAFAQMEVAAPVRAIVLILLLGGMTMASSLWMVLHLPNLRAESQGLLGVFALNALCGVATVWMGTSAGTWIWQLNGAR